MREYAMPILIPGEVRMMKARLSRIAVAMLIALAATRSLGAQEYHVAARFSLGGDGGWDYLTVDTAHARVFVTRSDRVMVVDQASGRLLGEIAGLKRGHG